MEPILSKIVSGGQTGADRGALDAALDLNFSCGGWCPEGRLAEDGPIPSKYPLIELAHAGYPERTLKNLLDSDGTVVIFFDKLSGGSLETMEWCKERNKPIKTIDGNIISANNAAVSLIRFISEFNIHTLNVAGPRLSKKPRSYQYTYEVIYRLLIRDKN